MDYKELQKTQDFFTKGPNFRYTVSVSLDTLIEYLKKNFGWKTYPQESHLRLAEFFDKNIEIGNNHPYVEYLNRVLDQENKTEDRENFIKQIIASRKRVFDSIKSQKVIYEPAEISICGNKAISFHGYHRTAYAKYLEIKNIKVSFLTLDIDLIELATKLFSVYDETAELYQPIETPFFELCPVQHPETAEKAKIIEKSIKDKTKKVIEVGAHLGYYSRYLMKKGFSVSSVDFDKLMFECQKHMEAIGFQKLDYNFETFQSYIKRMRGNFTLVAMAIFHIYMREGTWMKEALTNEIGPWIKNNVSTLIVEHAKDSDKQLTDYWKKTCGFKTKRTIYKTPEYNRTTYIFEK